MECVLLFAAGVGFVCFLVTLTYLEWWGQSHRRDERQATADAFRAECDEVMEFCDEIQASWKRCAAEKPAPGNMLMWTEQKTGENWPLRFQADHPAGSHFYQVDASYDDDGKVAYWSAEYVDRHWLTHRMRIADTDFESCILACERHAAYCLEHPVP
jgi:hypothetical protein